MLLPGEVNGRSVTRYRLVHGPALSGLAGRSMTWIPRPSDAGATRILLFQTIPPADSLASDTLVVRIDVSS